MTKRSISELQLKTKNQTNLFLSKKSAVLIKEKTCLNPQKDEYFSEQFSKRGCKRTQGCILPAAPCMSCCQLLPSPLQIHLQLSCCQLILPTMSGLTWLPQQILPMFYAPDPCYDQLKKRSCVWWCFPQDLSYYCINILKMHKSKIWFCSLYNHDDKLLTSFSVISM